MTALFTAWGVSIVLALAMPVMLLVTMIGVLVCVSRLGKVLQVMKLQNDLAMTVGAIDDVLEDDGLDDVASEMDNEQLAAKRRLSAYDRAQGAE